ncbi:hypothetical protein [Lewinella sp. 4G2]|uniref:hypothetical protein n=1 Tax=Lewinella sp. 4G2 TaxID=1803372 RepID=UPI0007B48899|nr:hypothetical protein [Lewinella sp. 4G2]OAV44075.1 hypothetical protein A3850_005990 [Lewinella sp. 4G2]
MRSLVLICTLSFLCTRASAQIGLHPPAVDWQQLTTDEGNVIYPKGFEARAQRVANIMAAMRAKQAGTVGDQHYKFDLILQTPNTTINGYVALAPFRSEFFLTPPQQPNLLSNMDWVDLLTIHEFRHVQQNSNERRGLTRLASYLAGQQSWAGISFFATPNWYSEGDAVVMETALTEAGRGRTPAFSATLRSLLDEGIMYNYTRSRNNSLKRNIPDHYRYGYNTITYARQEFGYDIWKRPLHVGTAWAGLLYPFSQALKRGTGLGTRKMYRAALEDLRDRQEEDLAQRGTIVGGETISRQRRAVTDYTYPIVTGNGNLLALRSGFQHIPQVVRIDPATGKEEVVMTMGIQRESFFHARGDQIVWMENRNDPRYTNESFSDVFIYNYKLDRKARLSRNQRYFAPSLNADGTRIVAVEEDVQAGELALVILSAGNGSVLQRIKVDANSAALPQFSPDGQWVYYYEKGFDGTAIAAINLASEEYQIIKPATHEALGNFHVTATNDIVYSSGRDGVDNVYVLNPSNGKYRQLTNVRIGAEFPFLAANGDLYYSEAHSSGRQLKLLKGDAVSKSGRSPVGVNPAGPSVFERPYSWGADAYPLLDSVPDRTYPSMDISDNLSGIRLHSWSILADAANPGFGIEASNALNTISATAIARYNWNEERVQTNAEVSYGGLFPVLTAGARFIDRNFDVLVVTDSLIGTRRRSVDQLDGYLTASVPLNWTASEYLFALRPSLGVTRVGLSGDSPDSDLPASFGYTTARLDLNAQRRRARQQVHTRLGFTGLLELRKTISGDDLGQAFRFNTRLWLPGVARTHGVRLDFDFQREDGQNPYQFPDFFRYSRGYSVGVSDRVWRFSGNYELPVWHPDFGFAGLYYLRRVRLNAFLDYGKYSITRLDTQTMASTGVEFYFDHIFFNVAPVSVGFRFSYLLEDDIYRNEAGSLNFDFTVGQRF